MSTSETETLAPPAGPGPQAIGAPTPAQHATATTLRPPATTAPAPRPGGRAARGRSGATAPALSGETTKTYDLGDPQLRTVAHLRRIVQQKEIPPTATFVIQDSRVVITWSD
jgi:hypothetical protein